MVGQSGIDPGFSLEYQVKAAPDREVPKSLSLSISSFPYWPHWTLKRAM